jgi:hypothetical protein
MNDRYSTNPFLDTGFIQLIVGLYNAFVEEEVPAERIHKEHGDALAKVSSTVMENLEQYQHMYDSEPNCYSLTHNYLGNTSSGYLWKLAEIICLERSNKTGLGGSR